MARLQGLKSKAEDRDLQAKWRAIKYQNKERLAAKIKVGRWPCCAGASLPELLVARAPACLPAQGDCPSVHAAS